jgi:putative peptidoglycan lipid II flippase
LTADSTPDEPVPAPPAAPDPRPDGRPDGANAEQSGASSEAAAASASATDQQRVARGAGIIAAFTLLSRIAGFVRDQVIVHVFGATRTTDAFWMAFTIPNVMRRLVAEGALTVAFVPIYKEVLADEGEEPAKRFLAGSLGLVLLGVLGVTVLGILGAEGLIWVFASGFADDPAVFDLAVQLTRWLFPYVYMISLVALAMGALNAHDRWAAPAAAPIFLNVSFISLTLFFADAFDPPIFVLVAGVLVGGLAQVLLQLPALARAGLLVVPRFELSPRIRELLRKMAPQVFALASYQLNIILLRQFASYLPEGQVTYYYNADRLMQFAYGVFAVAIAQAALTTMSEQRAAAQYRRLLATWRYSVRLTSFVTLPASLGLMAVALPVAGTFYLHGAFGWDDVQLTAWTTVAFAPGLAAQGIARSTIQVFYSLKDTKTPVAASFAALLTVLVSAWLLMPYEVVGLAAALSISAWVQVVLLLVLLRLRIRSLAADVPLGLGEILKALALQAAVAVIACGAAWAIGEMGDWQAGPTVNNVIVLFGAVMVAIAIYGGGALALRFEEVQPVLSKVRRKLGR